MRGGGRGGEGEDGGRGRVGPEWKVKRTHFSMQKRRK